MASTGAVVIGILQTGFYLFNYVRRGPACRRWQKRHDWILVPIRIEEVLAKERKVAKLRRMPGNQQQKERSQRELLVL
jgi:hypothetical protein